MAVKTIAEALRAAIAEEMRRDERVFCIGEDIGIPGGFGGAFTVTLNLEQEFRDRIIDTPISEILISGAATGAAMAGLRPIADVQYGDFLLCMMDQLVDQTAKLRYMSGGKLKVPMVMRAPVGATTRGAQHAQSLEGFFTHVPGLKVICPATAYDAVGLLRTAIHDDDPVMMFEHKKLYGSKGNRAEKGAISAEGEVPDEYYTIPFGQAVVRREGTDVTILANLQINIDGMLRFADFFFDGLLADSAVLERIKQSLARVEQTREQILTILRRLHDELEEVHRKAAHIRGEIDTLILQTEL